MEAGAPRRELVSIENPQLDIRALERRVRVLAAELRAAGLHVDASPDVDSQPHPESAAGPWRSPVADSARLVPYAPLAGSRAGKAVRRATRRALRWYLWPVTAQISAHNEAVSTVFAEHARQLARARDETERLGHELDLRGRHGARAGAPDTGGNRVVPRRVALVVARFGAEILGGAEKLSRDIGLRLAARGHAVTVLTTCAQDYVTWADELPAGESHDGPLRVLRFPVRAPRDLERWNAAMQPILAGHWTEQDEEDVLREAGPDAPALLDHLRTHATDYDAVIFFTLLYAPAAEGLPLVWERAILVPTLHDELASRLHAHGRAILSARQVMWSTPEEREVARRVYDVEDLQGPVCGTGVEPPASVDPQRARDRFGLERPYLVYAGRIDLDKGCGELIANFAAWSEHNDGVDLVLAGRAWMDIPTHPHVRHVGVIDGADLWDLIAGAAATVVPSRRESLSMLALESLACGVPILVPSGSPVLEGHVRRGAAGIVYADAAEFAAAAQILVEEAATRDALGDDGRRYVTANFTWERIETLYEDAIAGVARGTIPALP